MKALSNIHTSCSFDLHTKTVFTELAVILFIHFSLIDAVLRRSVLIFSGLNLLRARVLY